MKVSGKKQVSNLSGIERARLEDSSYEKIMHKKDENANEQESYDCGICGLYGMDDD